MSAFKKAKAVTIPEDWPADLWYGFKRHHFFFEGQAAWIVVPYEPAPDNRWSWCMQWEEAFVPRVGTVALLEHGFYHVHIDVFEFKCSPRGIGIMSRFQEKLVSIGLSPKANLIGMSWGGYFSLRYSEEHPENVCAIYLDAPVCNAADPDQVCDTTSERTQAISEQYGMSPEELATSKLNPLNNIQPLLDAKIPIFACIGQTDMSVNHETNFDIFQERYEALGGMFYSVRRRNFWGHHPHGLDNVEPLLKFHKDAR